MKFKYEGRWVNADQLRALRDKKSVKIKVEAPKTEKTVKKLVETKIRAPKKEKMIETSTKSIEELRTAYEIKFGKPIANSYKNRAEWIQSKLNNK